MHYDEERALVDSNGVQHAKGGVLDEDGVLNKKEGT